ncbi:MAG: UMP kinase [Chlamydiota bacterium]
MMKDTGIKRILLKLSGETIMGPKGFGIDFDACKEISKSIKAIHSQDIELGIVIGGGNIFRGINLSNSDMERTPADHMGMLATLMNGTALQQAIQLQGCPVRLMSALDCPKVADSYNWRKAHEYLQAGEIVIFVGGTGSPYFTTDTASALRASEIHADILLKATKVDGIYSKDPLKFPDAVKYDTITYKEALEEELKIMDATAFALCMSESIPIFVFNMERLNKLLIRDILSDHKHGTIVTEENK